MPELSMPEIPPLRLVETKTQGLSVDTRIEILSNIIAGVLHNGYSMQHNLPTPPLANLNRKTQEIYESFARLAVMPLFAQETVREAERQAVYTATDIIGQYMDEDEVDDGVPSHVWQRRIEEAVAAAIVDYHKVLMGKVS